MNDLKERAMLTRDLKRWVKLAKRFEKSDKFGKEIWGKSIAREVTDLPDDTAASDGRDAPSVRFWNMSNI